MKDEPGKGKFPNLSVAGLGSSTANMQSEDYGSYSSRELTSEVREM